jgi:hypothetical protein
MTSTMGQDPHPDVMEIADLAEGIALPERAGEVRAHTESCVQCGEVLASLREIRALLGELPQSEPMPADVAARIDAALAAEARIDAAIPHVPRETSLPAQVAPEAASVPRGTSAPAGRPTAPTGPGRGRRWRRGLLFGAASVASVLALTGVVYELATHSSNSNSNADSSAVQSSGDSTAVGDEVARLLEAAGGKHGSGGAASPMLGARGDVRVAGPGGTVITVPTCVLRATHRTQQPLAADREPYQGVDSFLIVLPDPADTTRVDAYVIAASCAVDTPGDLLFQDSYPRG